MDGRASLPVGECRKGSGDKGWSGFDRSRTVFPRAYFTFVYAFAFEVTA
jgi:hypothetical protein